MKNKNLNKKGFTLVEIMVSIAIFSLVLVAAMGAILSVVDANRKAQTLVEAMNNLNFAMESISRTIKTGIEHQHPSWAEDDSSIYIQANDLLGLDGDFDRESVNFALNSSGQVVRCVLENENTECDDPDGGSDEWIPLTSSKINIDVMNFEIVHGDSTAYTVGTDFVAPRVLITMRGSVQANEDIITTFNLQTTVSQRDLNLAGDES
jgi:prepilin-type N-terminal cleavage/methylation domain-containing protein